MYGLLLGFRQYFIVAAMRNNFTTNILTWVGVLVIRIGNRAMLTIEHF